MPIKYTENTEDEVPELKHIFLKGNKCRKQTQRMWAKTVEPVRWIFTSPHRAIYQLISVGQ